MKLSSSVLPLMILVVSTRKRTLFSGLLDRKRSALICRWAGWAQQQARSSSSSSSSSGDRQAYVHSPMHEIQQKSSSEAAL
jgi:hypothetical protein